MWIPQHLKVLSTHEVKQRVMSCLLAGGAKWKARGQRQGAYMLCELRFGWDGLGDLGLEAVPIISCCVPYGAHVMWASSNKFACALHQSHLHVSICFPADRLPY